jgi:hypothetical protein
MKLQKLVSKGFKGQEYDLELGEVNLIHGENRSGKTAIIAALQACCCGEVDKVGGANAKLALLADSSKRATAALTLEEDHELSFSVSQGKTASVSRAIKVGGMPLETKLAQEILFGGVPQYPRKLFSLTGEELWSLMMPQGDGKTPELVAAAFNMMRLAREKAGLKSDVIRVPLESTDIGVASNDGLKAAKDALSEIKQMIKGAELQLATDIPIYDGPSKPEVAESISVLQKQLDEHQMAVRNSKLVAEEIARTEATIAKYVPEYFEALRGEIAERERMIAENEAIVLEAKAVAAMDRPEMDVGKVSSVIDDLAEAWSRFLGLFKEHHSVTNADERVREALAEASNKVASLYQQVKESPFKKALDSLLLKTHGLATNGQPEYVAELFTRQNKTLAAELEAKRATLANSDNLRQSLSQKLDELRARSFSQLEPEQVSDIVSRLEGFKGYASQIQQVELLEKRREQVQEQLSVYQEAEKYTAILIDKINDWRRDVIDSSIKTICETANERLADVGFDGIKITLSTGKRSSATIETLDGIHLQTLSGAEETIYGTALLHAIQKFRNVKCPVIFVEGGELSEHYLELFLQSYLGRDVNLVVAHYLSPVVEGVNYVSVGELVD